jgi:hypothetical protein
MHDQFQCMRENVKELERWIVEAKLQHIRLEAKDELMKTLKDDSLHKN